MNKIHFAVDTKHWLKFPNGYHDCFHPKCPSGKNYGVGSFLCGKCSKQTERHPTGKLDYTSYIICGSNNTNACNKLFSDVQNKDKTKFLEFNKNLPEVIK